MREFAKFLSRKAHAGSNPVSSAQEFVLLNLDKMSRADYALKHKKLGLCRNCPQPKAIGSSVYCDYHLDRSRIQGRLASKKAIKRLKQECLEYYGEKCSCCGESYSEFLTLEHIGGNGNNHRKALFKYNVGGLHMYRWLKRNNYPSGYTILCMNCNWATRYNNECPHKIRRGG